MASALLGMASNLIAMEEQCENISGLVALIDDVCLKDRVPSVHMNAERLCRKRRNAGAFHSHMVLIEI